MTLKEMKEKTLKLIEEISPNNNLLTDDVDIQAKIDEVINQIMFELCRQKKLPAKETIEVVEGQELDLTTDIEDFFQLKKIEGIDFEAFDNFITFNESGTAKILYYKYPKRITEKNKEKYKFELSNDVLEIMPYGIAADLLKSDVSSQYGQIYANRYSELKQNLDPRYNMGSITIESGLDI